jgi:hypothetical protein
MDDEKRHKTLTEIIQCNQNPKYRRLRLDKYDEPLDVCTYHIPRVEDKIICRYRSVEPMLIRMHRPDGSYDLIEYYECLRSKLVGN